MTGKTIEIISGTNGTTAKVGKLKIYLGDVRSISTRRPFSQKKAIKEVTFHYNYGNPKELLEVMCNFVEISEAPYSYIKPKGKMPAYDWSYVVQFKKEDKVQVLLC